MRLEYSQVLGFFLIIPFVWHWLLDRNWLFQKLGYWTQVTLHRYVKPNEAMSRRTLFRLWHFREGVCFLNHGSFGAYPT